MSSSECEALVVEDSASTRASDFINGADENDNTTITGKSEEMTKQTVISPVEGEEKKVEKLEVPSEELRCIQKQVLIEKMMTSSSPKISPKKLVEVTDERMEVHEESEDSKRHSNESNDNQPKRFRGGRSSHPKNNHNSSSDNAMPPPRKTFKLKSSVLDRVKSFLPEFKTANDSLIRLPDPSKLSLDSDSDRDEMDGAVTVEKVAPDGEEPKPGPSGSSGGKNQKSYVEMNLALYEESGSDTSSDDDDDSILHGKVKGLPDISKKGSSSIVETTTATETKSAPSPAKTAIATDPSKDASKSQEEPTVPTSDKTEP